MTGKSLLTLQDQEVARTCSTSRRFRIAIDAACLLKPSGRCYLQFREYGDVLDEGANTRPWSVADGQEVLREWSILSLNREPGRSGLVNIVVVAQPQKEFLRTFAG